MRGTSTTTGRHRVPRRPRGPLGLVVAVTVLLVGFGVAAALLPPNLTRAPNPASQDGPPTGGTGRSHSPGPDAVAGPTATRTPDPSATSAGPTDAPSHRATPTSRRAPSRTPDTANGGTEARAVLDLVNRERATNGCGAVTINTRLSTAARLHSEDQAAHDKMSHTGSDGSTPWQRSERAGYRNAISENVAAGYRSPAAVMEGWLNSPGHRANILDCRAKAMGLGVATSTDGTRYWTQMFGSVA